jgi:hypothetical protein
MSETVVVVVVFALSYGAIAGYAWYLHLRRRRAGA